MAATEAAAATAATSSTPWISAGSSVINSAVNGAINYALQKQQMKWNEQMMDKQNAWSLNMWNKTNEYNTPAMQKQRMLDAGMNPLYYGLDGSSASGIESAQALGYNPANLNVQNPYLAGLQADALRAQIENTQTDTAKKANETLTETQRRQKITAEIDNTKQELENLKSQKNLTDKQIAQIDKALEWADRMNQAVVNAHESTAKLNDSQRNRIETLIDGEKLMQAKTIEDFDKRWSKIEAEIKKMAKETGILELDIQNYALNHASNGFMGSGLSFQNFIRAFKGQPYVSDSDEPLVGSPGEPNITTNTD